MDYQPDLKFIYKCEPNYLCLYEHSTQEISAVLFFYVRTA